MNDDQLLAALRELPVPEHRPGFFDDLDALLEAESPTRPTTPRRHGRRRRLLTGAAAVAAVVALLLGITRLTGDDHRTNLTTDQPTPDVHAVQGRIEQDAGPLGGGGQPIVQRFVLTDDGGFRIEQPDGSVTVDDGSIGRPDDLATTFLRLDAGWSVAALARSGDRRVTSTTVRGRPAWRLDIAVDPDTTPSPHAYDHLLLVVDQQTSIPVQLTQSRNGRTIVEQRVVGLEAAVGPVEGAAPEGWRAVAPAGLADAAGFEPFRPKAVPAGYALAGAAVDDTTHTAVLTYRRGFDRLTVTTRADATNGDTLAVDAPLVRRALPGGASIVIDPRVAPHLYAVVGGRAVTVVGPLSEAELRALWASR